MIVRVSVELGDPVEERNRLLGGAVRSRRDYTFAMEAWIFIFIQGYLPFLLYLCLSNKLFFFLSHLETKQRKGNSEMGDLLESTSQKWIDGRSVKKRIVF